MAATGSPSPSAQMVGNAFVHQYYHILHQSPELVYRFYQDGSKLGRPEDKGVMSSITTMEAINKKILSMDYADYRAEIKTVDAQESLEGGVLVLVTGHLTGKDEVRRSFTQSFFLAPQDKGYFVLNDIFRYVEDPDTSAIVAPQTPPAPIAPVPEQDAPAVQENVQAVSEEPEDLLEEESDEGEVYNDSEDEARLVAEEGEGEGEGEGEEAPVDEVVDESPNDAQVVTETVAVVDSSFVQEEPVKKSYASIVKVMKENAAPSAVPATVPARPVPAISERQAAPPPQPAPAIEISSSNSVADIGSGQEAEADGYSIYIKSLPLNATVEQLEEVFKRFGPIKSGGIQVISNKQQGFCFGFVEFEVASAVQSAIEASPITIGGRQSYVEEKRTSSSRVNRGRFQPGRGGGYRSDGLRGRGNYGGGGGRGVYGRGDFNNRAEYTNRGGSRGGSSSRGGGDGVYQRVDHVGNGGGRMSRPGGLSVNAPAKISPRVSTPA
ncbi:hypothetical protein QJS04_geneDACA004492 [Acorus gramineus]|uniref:Uncharacterized protein n=1 Tax=Acorus gramineus TaxID=55184 RepID=A0AAV9B2Q2_ACOGR|nr:hypothetical protein QJS04_geneDACA004492 [Acorus gramineus]